MAELRRSISERRAESSVNRRFYHVDSNRVSSPAFRVAGSIFEEYDNKKRADQARRSSLNYSKTRPVGVGFGEKDNFGPDNSWETKDVLSDIPDLSYYRNQ